MAARLQSALKELINTRNFPALREMLKNCSPPDLALLIEGLATGDQVIVVRILPRKLAAVVFEYLTLAAQERLLKSMAQEEVAAILNDMAPDDRTTLLEELPATVTKQMLAWLTPEERAVAVSLLGYPEESIGRLMTPDYIAVRQDWSVQEVLDYIREHGQESETLSIIYVIDEHGFLIDEIRIRQFLLAPLTSLVSDLMGRRVVALQAADDQETAVTLWCWLSSSRSSFRAAETPARRPRPW
jgi:magnesium transporter